MSVIKGRVTIVGAGFSGLVTGFYLVEQGCSVEFIEQQNRVGGLLGTQVTSRGVVEQAANAFIANKELERISRVINAPLFEKRSSAKKRYIFRGGKARRWPLGAVASFSVLIFLIRFMLFKKKLQPRKGQSLNDWGSQHLGKEATEYLLSPAVQGIYATSASELSASLVLKTLFSPEAKARGHFSGSVAPRLGMGEWTEAMRTYLEKQGCQFKLSSAWKNEAFDHPLVLAVNLESAKEILKNYNDSRYSLLKEVKSLSITSLTLQLDRKTQSVVAGFGCLFPSSENFNAIGVLSNGDIFDGRDTDCVSETWIFNDAKEELSQVKKEILISMIHKDRKRMGRVRAEILESHCYQWHKAIPHYSLELEKQLESLELEENNIFLVGNYLGQLGLSRLLYIAKKSVQQVSEKGQWQKKQLS